MSSIAHLGQVVGAADAIPAVGFARAGPGPSTASRQMPTSLNTRSNNAYGSAHQSSY
ncbi:hypothetical protein FRC09_019222, partial [Ceratobasidium sp. 395]